MRVLLKRTFFNSSISSSLHLSYRRSVARGNAAPFSQWPNHSN